MAKENEYFSRGNVYSRVKYALESIGKERIEAASQKVEAPIGANADPDDWLASYIPTNDEPSDVIETALDSLDAICLSKKAVSLGVMRDLIREVRLGLELYVTETGNITNSELSDELNWLYTILHTRSQVFAEDPFVSLLQNSSIPDSEKQKGILLLRNPFAINN
jgi:hypothetical protein